MTPRESIMQIIANAWDEEVSKSLMSDISKCSGKVDNVVCPERSECWRYRAPATPHWQSYLILEVLPSPPCPHKLPITAQK